MKKSALLRILLISMSTLGICSCGNKQNVDDPVYFKEKKIELISPNKKEIVSIVDEKVNQYMKNGNIESYITTEADYSKTITLSWNNLFEEAYDGEYIINISNDKELKDSISFSTTKKNIEITNLFSDTKYYWNVKTKDGKYDSNIGLFYTENNPRYINVEGVTNIRDIGGWSFGKNQKIKQGIIYRGAEMNNKYTITQNGINVMNNDLKIKTDIDLRNATEADNITESPLGKNVDYKPFRTFEGYAKVTQDKQKTNYQEIFKILANPASYPIYFHCYQGADRTGTLAYLLEGLMGVSEEDLARDYELTTFSDDTESTYRYITDSSHGYSFIKKNIMMLYPADTVQESIEKYLLEKIMLTQDEIDSIKNILSGKTSVNTSTICSLVNE